MQQIRVHVSRGQNGTNIKLSSQAFFPPPSPALQAEILSYQCIDMDVRECVHACAA